MVKGIYTPLSGGLAQERVLEILANNLANVNTAGFKGDNVTFKLLEPEPFKNYKDPLPPANYKQNMEDMMPFHGNDIAYVGVAGIHRDLNQGPAMETKNPLNVMLDGDGYFTVQTEEGERFSRNGEFKLSPEGILMTQSGHPLLGEKGTIVLRGGAFEINHLGEIYQDGQFKDRLLIQNFQDTSALERTGSNYYFYGGVPEEKTLIKNPNVRQGFLEGSNVNAIKNITAMIIAHRSYEAYQKAISNYDQMMERSSNQLGDVRA